MGDSVSQQERTEAESAAAAERKVDGSPPERTADAELRSSFLGFVAHEVRNPLSTALWSAELLARLSGDERGGPRGEKLSGMCLRALQRLRLLIEDHFLAERLDVSGIPVRREAVSVRDAASALATKLGLTGLTLDVDEDLMVWVDRGMFDRALDALLAVASRGNASIRVDAVRRGGTAIVRFHGAPPLPDSLDTPQKGSPADSSGRSLALHMAVRVAGALGGSLDMADDAYLLEVPLASAEQGGSEAP